MKRLFDGGKIFSTGDNEHGKGSLPLSNHGMSQQNEGASLTFVPPKRSWQELRQVVRDKYLQQNAESVRVPQSFSVCKHPHIEGASRIFFLGWSNFLQNQRELTLQYVDVPVTPDDSDILEWVPVVESIPNCGVSFSKEEQLLRERKRMRSVGITSYSCNPECSVFIFTASAQLCVCRMSDEGPTVTTIPTAEKGCRLDVKLCPVDPSFVSFVRGDQLWLTGLSDPDEVRLSEAADRLAGVPSFVVQEEFDRFTGNWWQPKSTDERVRLLYELVDESGVDTLTIGDETYMYPRAGSPNPRSELRLVDFLPRDPRGSLRRLRPRRELSELFPWFEYLVRADWTPCGRFVWLQLMDRAQRRLALVLIPPEYFVPDDTPSSGETAPSPTLVPCVVYEEHSPHYINVSDLLLFLPPTPSDPPDSISFLWASQTSGYRHVYAITSSLSHPLEASRTPAVLRSRQLTAGPWEVCDGVWPDPRRGLLLFVATADTPLEQHLYATEYPPDDSQPASNPRRLTPANASHTVTVSVESRIVVLTSSRLDKPAEVTVHSLDSLLDSPGIPPEPLGFVKHSIPAPLDSHYSPTMFSFPLPPDDQDVPPTTIYGMYYLPYDYDPRYKYPVVLYVYGGPHVQLVTNSYKGLRYNRLQTLASLGYLVVVVDGRGSSGRGLDFESRLKDRMGTVEMGDQLSALAHLSGALGTLDLGRVAVMGWSYGGYLALMALAQHGDAFRVAVAAAPVVSWRDYDTAYTERYLGDPRSNPRVYKSANVLSYVADFPNEPGRLLLVHGLQDENVHFRHTSQLVSALVDSCKPYTLQVYPRERHGLRQPEANEHYEATTLDFLQTNM